MKTRILVCIVAVAAAFTAFGSAKKGSYIKKAYSLKSSQSATLVPEYDSEEKESDSDSGVAYYTMTLKRGNAYTIWITGGDAANIDLYVDTHETYYDDRDDEPGAGFDVEEIDNGATKVAYLYADDWETGEDGDPKSGKYQVVLSGEVGNSTTLNFTTGIRTFTRVGSAESPKVLSMSTSRRTYSGKLIDGAFHFRASLKAGHKYRVNTLGGTLKAPLDISVEGVSEDYDPSESEDRARLVNTNNDALVLLPDTSGKYEFVVMGDGSQSFKFQYEMVPSRGIAKHPAIPLLEENEYKATFVPGRISNSHNYYDAIIDEQLCKIYLEKGARWMFETQGAAEQIQMVAYNSSGKALATNDSLDGESFNTRVVITASAAGLYYVGVCDPSLDVDDVPSGTPVTLVASPTETVGDKDGYDPADDEYPTASQIVPYPATTNEWAVAFTTNRADAAALGAIHGPHSLNADDLYDVFAFPCRKGYTYKLRASFVTPDDATGVSLLTLNAKVFNILNGKERNVKYEGTISPAYGDAVSENDLTFKATVSGMHYLRVWVGDGLGLNFPQYYIHAIAANGTNELGLVKCDMAGGVGSWAYNEEQAAYANGSVVAVKRTVDHGQQPWTGDSLTLNYSKYKGYSASGFPSGWTWDTKKGTLKGKASTSFTVKFSKTLKTKPTKVVTNILEKVMIGEKPIVRFNKVSGYTVSPDNVLTNIPAWNVGDEPVTVTTRYSDTYDAKYKKGTKTVTKNGKKVQEPVYSPDDGDATAAGAFAITPKATVTTVKRTLWANDPADHFSFTAATNVYYNFSVASTLAGGAGDAAFMISNATVGVVYPYTNEITRALLPVGLTYVIVSHGTEEKADSSYAFTFSRAAGGIVRFTNAKGSAAVSSFTVKEGSAAATLYVQRTGTEGVMRVRYATQAGTAVPGTNYYPVTDGELSWPAGNKAVKAVKINLIPDLLTHWEASNKVFTVRLYPVSEYDLAGNEYLPRIAGDTATVTITETSKKLPGTVSLASFVQNDVTNVVSNVKKPVVTGTAGQGQALTLIFTRTGGTDGPVSVKVASPTAAVAKKNKDTALAGTDYEAFDETLEWAEGDDTPKTVTVNLLSSATYVASKKFVFTIATVKTDGTLPALAAKTATFTILNDTVAETAAAYAKTIAAAAGLKLASTGTWFNDYDGTLRSGAANGTLTYTLTGPGFFACMPTVVTSDPEDAATLTCQFVTKVNKKVTWAETVTEFPGRLVRIIPAGTTTVKFTLSGVTGGAYVKFTPQADGAPYVWGRFADVVPVPWSKAMQPTPMDKAVVEKTAVQSLAWKLPDVLASESNLYCRVRFGTTAKPTEVRWYDPDHNDATQPEDFIQENGKTYYWALDYTYTDEEFPPNENEEARQALPWTPGPATWSFSTLKPGAPITSVSATSQDAAGSAVADLVADGLPVELIQCVQPNIDLDGTETEYTSKMSNKFRLLGGALPKGVKIDAGSGVLTGVPTTPGTYTALLQSYKQTQTGTKKVKGKSTPVYAYDYGTTVPVIFNVLPAGTMIGTFRGVLSSGDLTNDARRLALLTLTTTSAGKITAKATIGGIAYSFSDTTGFDELLDRDETADGCTRHVRVELTTKVKKLNSKKKVVDTDEAILTLTLGDGALTNAVALAEAAGTAELSLNVLNSARTAWEPDVFYSGALYRNNGATEAGTAALASYEGYYTAALVPEGVSAADGIPAGNGYLTFTVAKTGAVKVAGSLADGTAVSFSTIGQLVGDTLADPTACTLVMPVFAGSAAYVFGGEVKIAFPTNGEFSVVLPSEKLVWEKNAAKTTSLDGMFFAISLAPTGGWYDNVVNLQNYYLNRGVSRFAIETIESGDDLPTAALTKNYSFSTLSSPNDLDVSFTGNNLTVAARKLVKNKTTGLSDFGTSVNPWNTTVKLNRATGLVSGTFNAWEWITKNDLAERFYDTAQMQISSLAHKGVLLYTRDNSTESPLDSNVLTAGYFLMPATTSTKAADQKKVWKASLPFNILFEKKDPDWFEKEDW